MLQFYADSIDQLDFALEQLRVDDRNHDRFAIMLVDNGVELTLYCFAESKAQENRMWRFTGDWKYDPSIVEKGLGKYSGEKAKAARKLGLLDQEVQEAIVLLHEFRNTAHHLGLRHDGILRSLTIFYFELACSILANLEPSSWTWTSADRYSERAQKYLDSFDRYAAPNRYIAAFAQLAEQVADMRSDMVADLARDMKRMIDATDEQIDFLARSHPGRLTRNSAVMDAQAWALTLSDKGRDFVRGQGVEMEHPAKVASWLLANYPWKVTQDPIPKWLGRYNRLRAEKDRHHALRKYLDFLAQSESTSCAVEEAAAQLDMHIQQQIDEARGK